MHELSLYGSVPSERHDRLVQQLAGYACMQPQNVSEVHLVFKARTPAGLEKVQESGGSQGVQQQQQEIQRVKSMLQSGIYYVQLVGTLPARQTSNGYDNSHVNSASDDVRWTFEFRDTPEAGQQKTIVRQVSQTTFEAGSMLGFLNLFGYEFVHRYYVEGERFYHQDATLFLHRVRKLPVATPNASQLDISDLPAVTKMQLLDQTGGFVLQASVEITDGRVQDLRDRAEKQLLAMQTDLSDAVVLEKPDRLALDTRVPTRARPI